MEYRTLPGADFLRRLPHFVHAEFSGCYTHHAFTIQAMNNLHILLIDDHAIFRNGLRLLLDDGMPEVRVSEADSLEAVLCNETPPPDLVLLDIRLPGLSGLDGIALLKQRWPTTVVLILSGLDAPEAVSEALASGAAGHISKAEAADRILERIEVALGTLSLPAAEAEAPGSQLTPRQREILNQLCIGLSNKLIARRLALSENTVRRHVQDILEHFHVESRAEAVFAARRRGIVE
jgi:DNA-binding NarL/FixJ family response regulator